MLRNVLHFNETPINTYNNQSIDYNICHEIYQTVMYFGLLLPLCGFLEYFCIRFTHILQECFTRENDSAHVKLP